MSKKAQAPEWVILGKRATLIYEIFSAAFEEGCECKTCALIRENEPYLKVIFSPPAPTRARA